MISWILAFRAQSSLQIPQIVYEDPEVSGRNRYKYFAR